MTQNPFGEGGFDLNAMLEQAQQMQAQMEQVQAELMAKSYVGTTGGVSVTLTGGGDLTGVTFDPATLDGADPEDLGDLVVAAFRDARAQSEEAAQRMMAPITDQLGGLGGAGGPGGGSLGV